MNSGTKALLRLGVTIIFMAALLAFAGTATTHADTTANTVTVQGEGDVSAPPDTAIVDLGVSVQAQSVADARGQSAAAANAVIAAVKADGVADADIQTIQINLNPVYNNQNNQQVLTGYRADNILQVKVRALNSAGQVIDDAVAAGGDATVVQSISFTIDDTTALQHQARVLAIQNAHDKASDYATAAGATLGAVVSISEQSSPPPPTPRVALAAAPAAAPSTPVQAGTQTIRVQVQVVYALQ